MHIASIGIDLGKTTFHLVALGERNKVLVRKKFSRNAKMSSALIGLEACADSHYVGARLRGQGKRLLCTVLLSVHESVKWTLVG